MFAKMTINALSLPAIILVFAIDGRGNQPIQKHETEVCIWFPTESNNQFLDVVGDLQKRFNLYVVFAFPPHAIIGYVPEILKNSLSSYDGTVVIDRRSLPDRFLLSGATDSNRKNVEQAWKTFLANDITNKYPSYQNPTGKARIPLIHDMQVVETDVRSENWEKLTSEYLMGKIAVGVFIMESTGTLEDWSNGPPNRQNSVWEKIIIGLNWMHDQAAERGTNVEFWFDNGGYYESVPTIWEPITLESSNDYLWINDAMDYVGYTSGDSEERMYSYLSDLRSNAGTDWATIIFVIDDWNDEDNMFADEEPRFSYAKMWDQRTTTGWYVLRHGGPCLVMTYDNDNWGHHQMPSVLCHEFSHLFGCPDEYPDGYTCRDGSPSWDPSCRSNYGYLFYQNYNCEACNADPDSCIMRSQPLGSGMCEWTKRHLGWFDSDGDDVPDPIDPNSGKLDYIGGVSPGDYLLIYTLDASFVKRIDVTERNSAPWNGDLYVIWDMTNWNGQVVTTPQIFLLSRNGGDPISFAFCHYGPFAIDFAEPWVEGSSLVCSLSTDWAYVRLEIFSPEGEQVLYPIRDELHSRQERMEIDLSCLPYSDSYTARYFAWLPDGSVSPINEFVFASEEPLSRITEFSYRHGYYEPKIQLEWYDSNEIENGFALERKSGTSGTWQDIDTVPPSLGWTYYDDCCYMGSETYTYRVRPFTYNAQDGPWSDELLLKSRPMPPTNVSCEVLTGPCCPVALSNAVRVSWDAPQDQLLPIDHYVVFRRIPPSWMGDKFGPIYDIEIEICPNPHANRDFFVYSFDSEGDSSIVQEYCGAVAGAWNLCPENIKKDAVTGDIIQPGQFSLQQNYPNPFNASTAIEYELPADGMARVEVFNMLGRRVRILVDGFRSAGRYVTVWNGRNDVGEDVSSGVYFCRITSEGHTSTKRMLLLK